MNFSKFLFLTLLTLSFFTACEDDTDDPNLQGSVRFEITDAPSDDADVEAVFVTVIGVRVDGELSTTEKATFDLSALQNGSVRSIGEVQLDARTYNSLELVLDYETDASGNAPGCYVETTDGTRHALEANTSFVSTSNGEFSVNEGDLTTVIIDFDLRKALRRDESNAEDRYDFATSGELSAALRFVEEEESGEVTGSCTNHELGGEKVIVYAYERGTYDQETEVNAQGSSEIRFAGAVTSAELSAGGDYQLNFLKPGAYELHFFGYTDNDADNDGRFELTSKLQVETLLSLDLLGLELTAGASLRTDVTVVGVTPLF